MKKLLLILAIGSMPICSIAQTTIFDVDNVTFDDFNLLYQAEVADTAILNVSNPDTVGNSSSLVGMFVRGTSTENDKWNKQIRLVAPCDTVWDVASAFPADTSTPGNVGSVSVTMDVWCSAPAGAVFELSYSQTPDWPNYRHATYRDTSTTSRQWETLTFTYENLPPVDAGCCGNDPSTVPATDSVPIVFIAFGHGRTNATPDTFYFDNIQMVDLMVGGNDEYCVVDTSGEDSTDAIATLLNPENFNIMPNPSNDGYFNVNYTVHESSSFTIEILDNAGRIISTPIITNVQKPSMYTKQISTTNLKPGMYIVRISNKYGRVSKKIVIN